MTRTARPARWAATIAATTARKSRATRMSGNESRKSPIVAAPSSPGGRANSIARTLAGRWTIGTVRTPRRSASRGAPEDAGRSLSVGSAWARRRRGCARRAGRRRRAVTLDSGPAPGSRAAGPVRRVRRSRPRVAGRFGHAVRGRAAPGLVVTQVQIERAEAQLRLHLQDDVRGIVREPDLRLAMLREDATRLDDRLHDDGVERARRHLDPLPAQDADRDRVRLRVEVLVERVRVPDVERERAHEIQERAVVERVRHRRLRRLPIQHEIRAVGVDLVVALADLSPFVEMLREPERRHRARVEPALERVVHVVEDRPTLDAEDGVERVPPAQRLHPRALEGAAPDVDDADFTS